MRCVFPRRCSPWESRRGTGLEKCCYINRNALDNSYLSARDVDYARARENRDLWLAADAVLFLRATRRISSISLISIISIVD